MFLIDKVQYEAARNAAEAAVKVAEANVATNRLTVKNKTDLQAQNIISEYDLEMAQNTAEDCRGPARAGESPAGVGRTGFGLYDRNESFRRCRRVDSVPCG